ncbi:MAG: hypothetical protein HYV14_00745 [Elusimicrobia bacterium]|nr:hypothetical protein [Elusimicrobiota bacterium]
MPGQILVIIETPEDEIIHVAGETITFQCHTVPAGFEDKVMWMVPETQYASRVVGKGKIFTTSFSSSGLKQVIAAGPAGEYTEVTIDRRLVDPIPVDPRQEPADDWEEENPGGTGVRPLPPEPEEPPPPIDVIIEDVIQTKPDTDDVLLYVYKETTEATSGDILDSDPPPEDHRRRYQRSPKRGGHSEQW